VAHTFMLYIYNALSTTWCHSVGRRCAGFAICTAFIPTSAGQDSTNINAEPANLKAHATIGNRLEFAVVVPVVLNGTRECKVCPVFGHQQGSRFWPQVMTADPNLIISQRSAYSLGKLPLTFSFQSILSRLESWFVDLNSTLIDCQRSDEENSI